MNRLKNFEKAKRLLINDSSICDANRKLFSDFFKWEERKLKRTNNLIALDDACYKTLSGYIGRFRNVNSWFENKSWKDLTKKDIQKVYDDLEDGIIKNRMGKPYVDRKSYYTKVFKAKPFKLAGKSEISEEVFEFFRPVDRGEVNYIVLEDFKKLFTFANTPKQKFLLWLGIDIGENIMSLLQLKKRDIRKIVNADTKEPEYLINLRKEILKRSRRARVEITNFKETIEMGDIVLDGLSEDDFIFDFGQQMAAKFMKRCAVSSGVKCLPTGKEPTFKDLRSSMCCHLLSKDWSMEEVNSRLGHSPSNLAMVGRYANYLALGKKKPKKKLYNNNLQKIREDLEESKSREKLVMMRMENLKDDNLRLEASFDKKVDDMKAAILLEIKSSMSS